MLQSIHDNAKGWVAYLIVILISVPFALWGIQEYIGGSGKTIVAVVNGEDIELQEVQNAVADQRQRMMQMFGKLPPGFDDSSLKQSALDEIINKTLLEQYAEEKGYRASPNEVIELIRTIPQFQNEGKFDSQLYRQVLASQGRNTAEFEQQLRSSLTNEQFRNAIASTAFMPKSEMQRYQSLSQQKRDIEIYTLNTADVVKDLTISDEKIEEYFKENPDRYQTDEMVKVSYVELKQADINKLIEVTDELLQAHYDDNADLYFEKAKFKMSHIKVGITEKQTEEQAKAKADALYSSISSGEKSFEGMVASKDDETLFTELADTVGFLQKGSIDIALEEAVFAASSGDLIKPIQTSTGFEIIKVLEIIKEHQKPFEKARADVEKSYRNKLSAERYEDQLEILKTSSFENDGSLEPAAKAIDSEIKHSEFFSRNGGKKGIAANPATIDAAFRDDVLSQGINSSLIEISKNHALVLRLDEHKIPQQKPLADVRDVIIEQLKKDEGQKLVKEKGEAILSSIQTAGNWDSLGELATSVKKHADVGRSDPNVMPFITQEIFKLQTPSGKPIYTTIENPNGDYSIVALTAVKQGEDKLDEAAISQFSSYIGNRIQTATMKALHKEAEIETFLERLNRE